MVYELQALKVLVMKGYPKLMFRLANMILLSTSVQTEKTRLCNIDKIVLKPGGIILNNFKLVLHFKRPKYSL